MENIIVYFIKSSSLTIVFYLSYYALLRKETFFNQNRWFLLSGLLTSALLPLLIFKKIVYVEQPQFNVPDVVSVSNSHAIINTTEKIVSTINWFEIALFGYLIVLTLLLLNFGIQFISLLKLLKNRKIEQNGNYSLINIELEIAPFSFFNFIVFNSKLYSESELENILSHEKVHSSQKHSLDVLFANLFCIVFWFNPIIWLYKKAIIQNLEFIADEKATQNIEDKKQYQITLLKAVSNQNCLPITNHFYQSLIKKRIIMLNKNQSHRRNSWKYAIVIPALVGFVLLFQIKVVAQEKFIELKDGAAISPKTREVTDMFWTKNSSDEELKKDATVMAKSGIVFIFSDIKRNTKGEIIKIKIHYKDKYNNQQTEIFFDKKGIKPIYFKRDIDLNGKGKIGLYSDNKILNTEIQIIEDKTNEEIVETDSSTTSEIAEEKNMLYIINGKEYSQNDMKGITAKCDGSITHLEGKEAIEKYGLKAKDGVLIFNGNTVIEPKLDQQNKSIIITVDSGDEIVFMNNKNSVKIPGNPSALIDNSLIVIINGEVQKNAKNSIDNLDLTKIKSIKIVEEKDNSEAPIRKMIITTK